MATEIVASKIKALNSNPGQNGFLGPSSLTPGHSTPEAANRVAPPASLPANTQTRPVSAAQAVPTHPGMKPPSHPAQIERAISRQGPARK